MKNSTSQKVNSTSKFRSMLILFKVICFKFLLNFYHFLMKKGVSKLKVNPILIQGTIDDDLIIPTDQKTYKLRGIKLPTSLLLISQKGSVDLQLNHFVKLEEYDHQYHKIYKRLKQEALRQEQFNQNMIQQLVEKFGIQNQEIKQTFKISLKQFNKFQQFVDFVRNTHKRLFIPISVLLNYMRALMTFLTQKALINTWFTFKQLGQFEKNKNQSFFQLVAKKFSFDFQNSNSQHDASNQNQDHSQLFNQKIQIEQIIIRKYKVTFESVLNFIVVELAVAKNQYIARQMDDLIKGMIQVYIPLGMQTPAESQVDLITKRLISKYFIQTTKNNTILRVFYDPLEIESSLKGRINFMAKFKKKFTKDQIRGVFEGLILKQTEKNIKQLNQGGRKSVDLDDLLLKNFRKFNEFYQIKLTFPK